MRLHSSFFFFSLIVASSLPAIAAVGCSDQTNDTPVSNTNDGGGELDANEPIDSSTAADSGTADTGPTPTGKCADAFGDKLTTGFGRLDGIVWAVQKPSDTQCVMPNKDHVIVQVLMNGAVYRMVANVESDRPLDDGGPPPPVAYAAIPHALVGPAFAEGWHTGTDVALDYPSSLDAHNAAFAPGTLDELVAKIVAEVKVGDPISIYAQSGAGRPESAHLIHRNGSTTKKDGAIVVSPKTSPKFLLFHFGDQVF